MEHNLKAQSGYATSKEFQLELFSMHVRLNYPLPGKPVS